MGAAVDTVDTVDTIVAVVAVELVVGILVLAGADEVAGYTVVVVDIAEADIAEAADTADVEEWNLRKHQ